MTSRAVATKRPEAVLVPMKAFKDAKARLAPALSPDERANLARWMGERVLAAARPLPVTVACDDPDVAGWATRLGADVAWTPGLGLNGAVKAGVSKLARRDFGWVTVSHGDLPLAADLAGLGGAGSSASVTLVPDRHDDGTNVARVPSEAGFHFSYGPGSLERHVAEAHRLGLSVEVLSRPLLAWDVDVPDDLEPVERRPRSLR